jgi:hypothetical protein
VARHADVEDLPADVEAMPEADDHPMPSPEARNADLDLPSTPPEVLFDTGATHHLTGDKLALHNLKLLSKPIPLRVATNSRAHFITAVGTLHFRGPNSTCIVLDGVLYCSGARYTLISPAALRLSGFVFSYDVTDESFNVFCGPHLWVKSRLILPSCK